MGHCENCGNLLEKEWQQRFCGRSCSASYNNRMSPKRERKKRCSECGAPIISGRTTCSASCLDQRRIRVQRKLTEEERRLSETNRGRECRRRLKARSIEYKGGKCSVCGYDHCSNALEFHHIDKDSKDFSISEAFARHMCWEDIVPELDKCILICLNCHREVHNP